MAKSVKIDRSAFLYMDSKSPKEKFAQCGTCRLWTGAKHKSCLIHDPDIEITADMTCGLYVHGKVHPEWAGHEEALVTPEESGLARLKVRCENCRYGDKKRSVCTLFEMLNDTHGSKFDLDVDIDPYGCCNAFVSRKGLF